MKEAPGWRLASRYAGMFAGKILPLPLIFGCISCTRVYGIVQAYVWHLQE
jgi:hypothetical protein